jgi:Fe2+ or Zn2+ uptake regulation protein
MKRVRTSRHRSIILNELKKFNSHPSAEEVYKTVKKIIPKISISTVYRNLDVLTQQGAVKKLVSLSNEMRFDGNIEHHHHIICSRCGKIDDLHKFNIPDFCLQIEKLSGYRVTGFDLDFYGICSSCLKVE